MEIVVEFKHHMEVCSSEAVSPQYREPEMVDSPCRADSSTIVSCRHLVAHPVGHGSEITELANLSDNISL